MISTTSHTVSLSSASNGQRFIHATRINQSLTAALEKRLLQWMAMHTPKWITSDHLTVLGLSAQIAAGLCYAFSCSFRYALLAVIVCLILNWVGDSLDGTLARVRQQQRPRYGFYVDHMVDVIGAVALMCGLGFSGFLHWPVAMAMLLGFLVLAAESYLATYTLARFHLSQGIFGPTELRLLLIAGNIALLHSPYSRIAGHTFLLFDIGGVIASVGMFLMFMFTAARHTAELYRQEPIA